MQRSRLLLVFLLWLPIVLLSTPQIGIHAHPSRQQQPAVALAYVYNNSVYLADAQGTPLEEVGPVFAGEAGKLFWSRDGEILYIVRRDSLFQTFAAGGSAVQLPGAYSLSITLNRPGDALYYLERRNPQPTDNPEIITLPLRETNVGLISSGTGRLVGYVGQYPSGSDTVFAVGAALQYAMDGGLLNSGRPGLIPTYGPTIFYSCCFPAPGLRGINLDTGQTFDYPGAETLLVGKSATNKNLSRLAGPTSDNAILMLDLISSGIRNYTVDVGTIERVAWGYGDRYLYMAVRQPPNSPLQLNPVITTNLDLTSAAITIWRLDLVTGRTLQLASLGDFYGVSSMTVTDRYIFAAVVESNFRAAADLNAGRLPGDLPGDAAILRGEYLPGSILYRITLDGREAISVQGNTWGVVARP
jgi:hypothetical protein